MYSLEPLKKRWGPLHKSVSPCEIFGHVFQTGEMSLLQLIPKQVLEVVAQLAVRESSAYDFPARVVQWLSGSAILLTGVAFSAAPVQAANLLGLDVSSDDGVVEIRAFYGAMEIGAGLYVLASPADAALLFVSTFLAACAMGRVAAVNFAARATWLHAGIACAETVGAAMALLALRRETAAKSKHVKGRESLHRRQIPNPTKLADFVPFCAENLQDVRAFLAADTLTHIAIPLLQGTA